MMLLLQADENIRGNVTLGMIVDEHAARDRTEGSIEEEEEKDDEEEDDEEEEDEEDEEEEEEEEDDDDINVEDIYAYLGDQEYDHQTTIGGDAPPNFFSHQLLLTYNDIARLMPHDIIINLFTFIQDITDSTAKSLAMQRLIALESRIMTLALDTIIQEDPEIMCSDVVQLALAFVRRQPAAFRANYVETFTYDCATAYDSGVGIQGNLSCSQGVWERLVTSIANGGVGTDVPLYQELAGIMQNHVTPETIQTFTAQCVNLGAADLLRMSSMDARVAWVKTAVMHKLFAAARVSQIHPVLPAVNEFVEAARPMLEDDFLEK